MKTVVYYEWVRKGRSYIIRCVLYLLIILLFFVITMICEKLFPEFSYNYMNWPQYIRNIIGMRSWHRILWLNIWQIGCIIFAFIINYFSMSELAESIINEKKRETYVYLFNAGVKKSDIIFGKFIFQCLNNISLYTDNLIDLRLLVFQLCCLLVKCCLLCIQC